MATTMSLIETKFCMSARNLVLMKPKPKIFGCFYASRNKRNKMCSLPLTHIAPYDWYEVIILCKF